MLAVSEHRVVKSTILLVSPHEEDHRSINGILKGSIWNSRFVRMFEPARNTLRKLPFKAVICESRLSDGHCWKDILRESQAVAHPPPLVVADRLADEALWAEVLNLGGYDVLMKPFDEREVLHVLAMACRFGERDTHHLANHL